MQFFAIIPAAGRSTRMGTPKLLLPWQSGTIIELVLEAWRSSSVGHVLVVVDPADLKLAEICRGAGADVIVAGSSPPDMKASVLVGLNDVEQRFAPTGDDAWLVAPADIPALSARVIDRLLTEHRAAIRSQYPTEILVPVHAGRRGHPVLFPWNLAAEVGRLQENAGINQLLDRFSVREIDGPAAAIAQDIDTPDDYRRHRPHDP